MSTPRTDTIAHFGHHPGAYIAKMTDLARDLEQELAEKTEAIQDAADQIDRWKAKAKQERDSAISWEEKFRQLEQELAATKSSPYIDSDESPVEVLAGIYDALDGITDDAANGHNFGTLISRVKVAVQCAEELAAERALADLLANAVIDLRTLLKAYGRGDDTGLFALESWKEAR